MRRCLQLARCGAGATAPNPMVGAVLVQNGKIIGEGFHARFGEAHAEVNCLQSVLPEQRPLIPACTLYVSLEPCAHHGKTPPCADLIIREKIGSVVVGCRDPFVEVDGRGIEKLKAAGISVTTGVLEQECLELNRRFILFHTRHRPYLILKWAQTANAIMGGTGGKRLIISNPCSDRLVHRWRSAEASILIGTNTAALDNPELTTRKWVGKNPLRIVLDSQLRLNENLKIFDGSVPTLVFNRIKEARKGDLIHKKIPETGWTLSALMQELYQLKILSVMVEGGPQLIRSFIEEGLWDEARVITNTILGMQEGLPAPILKDAVLFREHELLTDQVRYYRPGRPAEFT
jgi:diaminohydroxyphosphoribosylaminopyrimidine deaminase / 5-amino-6-(5-phosphoribosylamino)uracil reductase